MSDSPVTSEVADGIATITLDRPSARNALSAPTASALADAIGDAERSEARAVVVAGAGDAFCAGGDLEAMLAGIDDGRPPAQQAERLVGTVNDAVRRVYECSLPTVAAIDGPAFGSGAGLAIACDVQLASTDAKLGFGLRRMGLVMDAGTSFLLPRLVGLNTAKELVFTGELLDADRARSLGLVNRVFAEGEFEAGVENAVGTIAEGPTVALTAAKRLLNQSRDSFAAATRDEALAQAVALATSDHEEGVRAFADRREPDFDGR